MLDSSFFNSHFRVDYCCWLIQHCLLWVIDQVSYFNPADIIAMIRELDPTRLVDTDSGGPANNLYIGDVNDIHDYPYPQLPLPSDTQYAMIGEFGGIGKSRLRSSLSR